MLWEEQGFGVVVFLLSFPPSSTMPLPPSAPDPSAIKQRFLFWHHRASSSDFRELWERLLTRNLELSCLRASPAHFPELSSRQCMRDFYQVWQEVCGPGTCSGCRYPARRAAGARRLLAQPNQQSCSKPSDLCSSRRGMRPGQGCSY